jgi:hypothetical protein
MVARSAYTQLRYSPILLAATLIGLAWLYPLAPVAALVGAVALACRGSAAAGWACAAGAFAWAVMSVTFLPTLRLYRLSPGRALTLPAVATLYAAMTFDSALRHYRGRGGVWKDRTGGKPASVVRAQR